MGTIYPLLLYEAYCEINAQNINNNINSYVKVELYNLHHPNGDHCNKELRLSKCLPATKRKITRILLLPKAHMRCISYQIRKEEVPKSRAPVRCGN
jgi:hypothetical protein